VQVFVVFALKRNIFVRTHHSPKKLKAYIRIKGRVETKCYIYIYKGQS